MRIPKLMIACVPFLLWLGACDKDDSAGAGADGPVVATAVPLEPGKTAGSFQLQAVVELVKGEAIADAAALEVEINNPDSKLNAVDLDDDGETDFVEVVEVEKGGATALEFRAIPSSKQDAPAAEVGVVIATITLEVEDEQKIVVHGSYTEHIEHDASVHVYHHEEPVVIEHGKVVVAHTGFYHYVFVVEHEHYHGHHHYVVVGGPTVHVHTKHKKHKKGKGYGHGKGHKKGHKKGHGSGVVVSW